MHFEATFSDDRRERWVTDDVFDGSDQKNRASKRVFQVTNRSKEQVRCMFFGDERICKINHFGRAKSRSTYKIGSCVKFGPSSHVLVMFVEKRISVLRNLFGR
jgi:hypothetical protein